MFVSCKCLNIILKYSGRQLVPTPELSFPNHEFFLDNSLITSTIDDNFLVLKRQPALVDQEIIDIWNITKCINCYQYTYAVSYNKNTDNPDNSNNLEPSIKYLVLNKLLINFDNLSDDNSKLIENLPDDNFKRFILTKDNSKLSDNFRLLVSDNLNSISDNSIPLISTKTLLITDDNNSHKSIAAAVDKNYSSLKSDKTIIFSDNLPLITGNSITSCSTTNSNDNSTFLIGGDNSKISTTIEDNSTLSGYYDNSPIEDDNSANENNIFIKMRNHRDFSDIYNIVVDCDNDSDDIDDNEILMMRKQLLPGVQESLGNLHQQYEAKVKNIKDIIEENIRQYTAKQYEYLENYKDQGHHHYYVLTNKILKNEFKKIKRENNTQVIGDFKSSDIGKGKGKEEEETEQEDDKTELVNSKISPNHSVRLINQDNSIVPGSLMYSDDNNKMTEGKRDIKREKKGGEKKAKRKQIKNHKGDIDDQVIFAIEGMDDDNNDDDNNDDDDDDDDMEVEDNNNASDNEDNDNDNDGGETDDSGQDEGIHIPRVQRGGHPTLAKSLPVAVPNFGFNRRKHRQNDDQEYVDPQDPHDIRASIKALAKSVHGDTVFGDLPRPRFSTEI